MNAAQVTEYVNAKWPHAMLSPVALAIQSAILPEPKLSPLFNARKEALQHAYKCIAAQTGWTVETLGHNIESNMPELDADECDRIAEIVLRNRGLI